MRHLLLPLLAFTGVIAAQEYRGAFSGIVSDPQGSAIPKAKITATETRTGTKSEAVSGPTGEYVVPFLAPGLYQIAAEAAGFKKYVRQGIELSAGQQPVIDIHLQLGAVNEEVTITANAPILETSNPTVGQTISTAEVDSLPVNGRTPMMLDNLAFGVVSTFEPGPVRPFDNGAPNSISIGGAPASRNEVLLDGSPNGGQSNQMAYSPPQDAVTEVRVNSFDMDASLGHTMGGTVNLITKSGTNSLHGSAYIYNQTSALDANSFFNNAKDLPRPPYHQNQYGINGGGPVLLPKIYNGKNRVFWFFAWEGMRDSDPANSPLETGNPENFATVPTAAERQGDFSALLNVPGSNSYVIYDPQTGVMQGTQVARQPFPNNVIPQNRLNPVALNFLKYFPLPNTPGLQNGQQNYAINAVDTDGYDNELGRLDVNLSDKNKLMFDARHNFRAQNKNNFFNNPATGNYLYRINQGASLDDVYTISPTLYTDVRANWTRYIENHSSPADGIDPATLGFPSYIDANAEFKMLPYITFASATGNTVTSSVSGGARSSFEPLGYNGDGTNFSDSFQLFGDVIKIHGNHTFKTGADVREYRWSAYTFGNPSGTYGFNSNWTNDPALSNSASPLGQELAAFLLGLPSSGGIDLNTQSTVQAKYLAFFVSDDWKVKGNLTLNLGLRWERDFPETERFNRSVNGFDPTATNPISAAAAAAYAANPNALLPANQFKALGGLTFVSASNPAIYHPSPGIFSPRLGFAWTPAALGNKTVIRGGVGVLMDPILLPAPNQEGFSQTTQFTATNNNYLSPATTLSDPFPGASIVQPAGSSKGAGTYLGQAISIFDPQIRNPYTIRWELSVQRELPGQMVLEVAYIGNHALHLPINTQLDYIPRQYLSASLVRDDNTVNLLTGSVANPFKGLLPNASSLNGSTVQLQQLLIPFPQYPVPTPPSSTSNGILLQQNPAGSSYYESLNVRLQKRLSHGLTLLNNFIWDSLIDRLAYLNDSDPAPEKRASSDSRPLRDVLAATYDLPIGRGRKLNLPSRWLDALVGGWGVNGIVTLQSGPVLGWGNYIYYGGPLNLQPHQPNGLAFDKSQFNTVSAQQLADNVRTFDNQFNNLRRDATNQIDTSMTKNFSFGEGRYVQVRFEAFNVFNHVTFGAPNTTATSSGFGMIGTQANTPRRIESAIRLVW